MVLEGRATPLPWYETVTVWVPTGSTQARSRMAAVSYTHLAVGIGGPATAGVAAAAATTTAGQGKSQDGNECEGALGFHTGLSPLDVSQ